MLVGCKYLALRQQMYLQSRQIYNWNFDNHIIFRLVIGFLTLFAIILSLQLSCGDSVYIHKQRRNKTIGRKEFLDQVHFTV